MIVLDENIVLVPISSLRTDSDKVLKALKKHKVYLQKNSRPVAVMVDVREYRKMEMMMEMLEDFLDVEEIKKRLQDRKGRTLSQSEVEHLFHVKS